MFKIIIFRGCLVKQGRGRNTRIDPNIVTQEPTLEEALAYIETLREVACGETMPFKGAVVFKMEEWHALQFKATPVATIAA